MDVCAGCRFKFSIFCDDGFQFFQPCTHWESEIYILVVEYLEFDGLVSSHGLVENMGALNSIFSKHRGAVLPELAILRWSLPLSGKGPKSVWFATSSNGMKIGFWRGLKTQRNKILFWKLSKRWIKAAIDKIIPHARPRAVTHSNTI